jgi:hypothetical protein
MLTSYREAVCWLARNEGGLLVVTEERARLVDVLHHRNEGLSLQAAHALTNDSHRALWFDTQADGGRSRLSLNAEGARYHRRLVERKQCRCPKKMEGRSHADEGREG